MAILGTNIVLYYWNGSSNIPFGAAKNCSFSGSTEFIQTASTYNGWFIENSPNLTQWTVNCDGLIANGNFEVKLMMDFQLARTPIYIKFTINTSPAYTIAGYANIVSINSTGPVESTATYSISLQGTGRYTIS
jgi:predicted secreted protein